MYKSKNCIRCQIKFIPNSPKQQYCKKCLTRICQKCGKTFIVKDPQYFPKFCSNICYFANRWGKNRLIEIKCLNCGNIFSDYLALKRKFCSFKCRVKWFKTHKRKPSNWKGGRIRYGSRNRYWAIFQPYHPFTDCKGYVFEHRLIMERHLKRFLQPQEIIHHINFIPDDNRLENLKLLPKREHDKLHTTERHKTQPRFGR